MYPHPDIKEPTDLSKNPTGLFKGERKLVYWHIAFALLVSVKVIQYLPLSFNLGGAKAHASPSSLDPSSPQNKEEESKTEETESEQKTSSLTPMRGMSLEKTQILQSLGEKEEKIKAREQAVKIREEQVQLLLEKVESTKKELLAIQKDLEQKEKNMHQKIEGPVKEIAKLYEGMKPDQAARILKTFDSPILARLMQLMSKKKASEVMALRDENKAKEVTMLLIQSNQTKSN